MPEVRCNPNDSYVAAYVPQSTKDKIIQLQAEIQLRERRRIRVSDIIRNAIDQYCERELSKK